MKNITSADISELDGHVVCRDKGDRKEGCCDKIKRITEVLTHKQSVIFTDGSVYGGIVGCGACAAVHASMEVMMTFQLQLKRLVIMILFVRGESRNICKAVKIVSDFNRCSVI